MYSKNVVKFQNAPRNLGAFFLWASKEKTTALYIESTGDDYWFSEFAKERRDVKEVEHAIAIAIAVGGALDLDIAIRHDDADLDRAICMAANETV